jgi:hypothetical protein
VTALRDCGASFKDSSAAKDALQAAIGAGDGRVTSSRLKELLKCVSKGEVKEDAWSETAESSGPAYKVGDKVFAHWRGSMFKRLYPGTITSAKPATDVVVKSLNEAAEKDLSTRRQSGTAGPEALQFPDRFPGREGEGRFVYDIKFDDGDTNYQVPEQALKPRTASQTKDHMAAEAEGLGYDLGVKGRAIVEQSKPKEATESQKPAASSEGGASASATAAAADEDDEAGWAPSWGTSERKAALALLRVRFFRALHGLWEASVPRAKADSVADALWRAARPGPAYAALVGKASESMPPLDWEKEFHGWGWLCLPGDAVELAKTLSDALGQVESALGGDDSSLVRKWATEQLDVTSGLDLPAAYSMLPTLKAIINPWSDAFGPISLSAWKTVSERVVQGQVPKTLCESLIKAFPCCKGKEQASSDEPLRLDLVKFMTWVRACPKTAAGTSKSLGSSPSLGGSIGRRALRGLAHAVADAVSAPSSFARKRWSDATKAAVDAQLSMHWRGVEAAVVSDTVSTASTAAAEATPRSMEVGTMESALDAAGAGKSSTRITVAGMLRLVMRYGALAVAVKSSASEGGGVSTLKLVKGAPPAAVAVVPSVGAALTRSRMVATADASKSTAVPKSTRVPLPLALAYPLSGCIVALPSKPEWSPGKSNPWGGVRDSAPIGRRLSNVVWGATTASAEAAGSPGWAAVLLSAAAAASADKDGTGFAASTAVIDACSKAQRRARRQLEKLERATADSPWPATLGEIDRGSSEESDSEVVKELKVDEAAKWTGAWEASTVPSLTKEAPTAPKGLGGSWSSPDASAPASLTPSQWLSGIPASCLSEAFCESVRSTMRDLKVGTPRRRASITDMDAKSSDAPMVSLEAAHWACFRAGAWAVLAWAKREGILVSEACDEVLTDAATLVSKRRVTQGPGVWKDLTSAGAGDGALEVSAANDPYPVEGIWPVLGEDAFKTNPDAPGGPWVSIRGLEAALKRWGRDVWSLAEKGMEPVSDPAKRATRLASIAVGPAKLAKSAEESGDWNTFASKDAWDAEARDMSVTIWPLVATGPGAAGGTRARVAEVAEILMGLPWMLPSSASGTDPPSEESLRAFRADGGGSERRNLLAAGASMTGKWMFLLGHRGLTASSSQGVLGGTSLSAFGPAVARIALQDKMNEALEGAPSSVRPRAVDTVSLVSRAWSHELPGSRTDWWALSRWVALPTLAGNPPSGSDAVDWTSLSAEKRRKRLASALVGLRKAVSSVASGDEAVTRFVGLCWKRLALMHPGDGRYDWHSIEVTDSSTQGCLGLSSAIRLFLEGGWCWSLLEQDGISSLVDAVVALCVGPKWFMSDGEHDVWSAAKAGAKLELSTARDFFLSKGEWKHLDQVAEDGKVVVVVVTPAPAPTPVEVPTEEVPELKPATTPPREPSKPKEDDDQQQRPRRPVLASSDTEEPEHRQLHAVRRSNAYVALSPAHLRASRSRTGLRSGFGSPTRGRGMLEEEEHQSSSVAVAAVAEEAVVRSRGGLLARKDPDQYTGTAKRLAELRLELLPNVADSFSADRFSGVPTSLDLLDPAEVEDWVRGQMGKHDRSGTGVAPLGKVVGEMERLGKSTLKDSDVALVGKVFAVAPSDWSACVRRQQGATWRATCDALSVIWSRVATWLVGTIDGAAAEIERAEAEARERGEAPSVPRQEMTARKESVALSATAAVELSGTTAQAGTVKSALEDTESAAKLVDAWTDTSGREDGKSWPESTLGGWLRMSAPKHDRANAARFLSLLALVEDIAGLSERDAPSVVKRALSASMGASSMVRVSTSTVAAPSLVQANAAFASSVFPMARSGGFQLSSSVTPQIMSRSLAAAFGAFAHEPSTSSVGGAGGFLDDGREALPRHAEEGSLSSEEVVIPLGAKLRAVVRFQVIS